MKKKAVIFSLFFGTIMLTSLAAGALLQNKPLESENSETTITNTPADNFPDEQRAQFCGSGIPKSTPFVKEYSIPTACTNPLAIVADYEGNVWFAQTNTGKLAKFDPISESFTEFDNPLWPKNGRSMIWGMDYSPDGSLWFTDESYDSIWKFSIEDKKYQRIAYPSEGNALPQKIKVEGSQIIINDFSGNKITFLDPTQTDNALKYLNLPSPVPGSVTSAFAVDTQNNLWYTNWILEKGGVLVKFDQDGYRNSLSKAKGNSIPDTDYIKIFQLPAELLTPNGLAIYDDGMIWIADTSSSTIFNFDPTSETFTPYVTSTPKLSTYGNLTGVIKSPISRPYWIAINPDNNLVFNEQTANSIGIMNPKSESLVEYLIPSKNPSWGDCLDTSDCGVAQIFDFTMHGDKIWFTEWVENNIGVIDTSIPIPFEIQLDSNSISLAAGESKQIFFVISPKQSVTDMSLVLSDSSNFLNLTSNELTPFTLDADSSKTVNVTISASSEILPGAYKVLVGAQIEDVSSSKFVTVTILP
ncbi:MAG: lyase [Nitrosarchaeum sp.]|nr:lyase [Nitrosarchaeum sp.]MBP0120321.1 lyase [Nitrosarchaeum sp.]MBP0134460.1 lyase [Nitrosarchaeum sp.]